MSAPIRVAVVGCGVIGQHHARVLTANAAYEVVAAVDGVRPNAERAADAVAETGAPRPVVTATLAEALAAGPIDLVTICTPSGLHLALAEEALAAGCHVVVEKPVDVSVARGVAFATLAREAAARGQVVSVISQHRFDPANRAVAEAAHAGRFGRLASGLASIAWWRSQQYYDSGDWRGTWALDGGGAVMNQGVHTLDLLVWMLGRPVEVVAHTAMLAHQRIEVEDVATASIRFASGALAVVHATTVAYPGFTTRVQVHGDRGSGAVVDDRLEYFHVAAADADAGTMAAADTANQAARQVPADQVVGGPAAPDAFVSGHSRQYDDVAAAVRDGRAPGVTADDALLSLATVKAIYVAATLGRPVAIDDLLDGTLDDQAVRVAGVE